MVVEYWRSSVRFYSLELHMGGSPSGSGNTRAHTGVGWVPISFRFKLICLGSLRRAYTLLPFVV